MHLTILIRDDAPYRLANLPPSYRTVRIVLTQDQRAQIGQLENCETIERTVLDGVPRK